VAGRLLEADDQFHQPRVSLEWHKDVDILADLGDKFEVRGFRRTPRFGNLLLGLHGVSETV
jgi:hypothetical protein